MRDSRTTDFIERNGELLKKWADREEKRVVNIELPFTEADYDRMNHDIMKRIEEKEVLKRIFGY